MSLFEKMPLILGTLLACLIPSCATEKPKPPERYQAVAPDGMILIEAETFRLVDSRIIDDPQASDGKAVTMLTARSFNSFEINLTPGTYVAVARVRAADEEHNELFLSTLKSLAGLDTGVVFNRYTYCTQVLEFTLGQSVKDFIQFAAFSRLMPKGEAGVIVDYIIICEKSRWEAGPIDLE